MKIKKETVEKLRKYKLYNISQKVYSIASRVQNRLLSGPIILLYHRVANLDSDPQLLAVSPQHFYEHMKYLKENYHIISLNELKRAMDSGKLPKKSVTITFDDGYGDNYLNARPVLEKLQIPASIFIVTSHIGLASEFWWDKLERLLLLPERLPDSLELTIKSKAYSWQIGCSRKCLENDGELFPDRWDVTQGFYPTPRHKAYTELHRLLRLLDDADQQTVLTKIAKWAEVSPDGRQDYRALSPDELKALADGGLIAIGAHTVTHPLLSAQPLEVQRREIIESKLHLEDILKKPVTTFCYPFGGWGDVDPETVQLVRDAGFEMACAGIGGLVTHRSDPFWLPRYLVRDWDGSEFAHRLRRLLPSL